MKLVGIEEHFVTADVLDASRALPHDLRDLALEPAAEGETSRALLEVGEDRIAVMDQTGLDVQVLSLTTPGVQNLPDEQALALSHSSNDFLAEVVLRHPDRFQGLATLPTGVPEAAVAELRRAVVKLGFEGAMVFGRTGESNMDDPRFWPVYEAAAALRAPLHLHPQSPPVAVRSAYYSGFGAEVDAALATFGIGWHYDAGVQLLRLILSGVFDTYPDLQVIVGHWGELVLFFLDRVQQLVDVADLPRPLIEYVRKNLYFTPSGILSERYLRWAIEVAGSSRILFSTDFPFEKASRTGARDFLDHVKVSDADRDLIASGNWERLRSEIRR